MPTPESTFLARLLAAKRTPKDRTCAQCGTAFTTIGRGIYCSDACRYRARNQRRPHKTRSKTE